MNDTTNPCISCGACCAYFRVSFYWAEADDGAGSVPSCLTEPLTPFLRCMRGTNDRHCRCDALCGPIGVSVSCAIYSRRPSSCREFIRSGENGLPNGACERARAYYGLPPLPLTAALPCADGVPQPCRSGYNKGINRLSNL